MIEVNDVVNVHFVHSESLFNCRITHRPCAEGDSWELEDERGICHRVSVFERMDFVGRTETGDESDPDSNFGLDPDDKKREVPEVQYWERDANGAMTTQPDGTWAKREAVEFLLEQIADLKKAEAIGRGRKVLNGKLLERLAEMRAELRRLREKAKNKIPGWDCGVPRVEVFDGNKQYQPVPLVTLPEKIAEELIERIARNGQHTFVKFAVTINKIIDVLEAGRIAWQADAER